METEKIEEQEKPSKLMACPNCNCTTFSQHNFSAVAIIQVYSDYTTTEVGDTEPDTEPDLFYTCTECGTEFSGDKDGFNTLIEAKEN
jgi:DNA-directed RNA polymerase subunit RPC12/RpoP